MLCFVLIPVSVCFPAFLIVDEIQPSPVSLSTLVYVSVFFSPSCLPFPHVHWHWPKCSFFFASWLFFHTQTVLGRWKWIFWKIPARVNIFTLCAVLTCWQSLWRSSEWETSETSECVLLSALFTRDDRAGAYLPNRTFHIFTHKCTMTFISSRNSSIWITSCFSASTAKSQPTTLQFLDIN